MNPSIEETRKYKHGLASRQGRAAACCHAVDKPSGSYRLRCVKCSRAMGMSRVKLGVVFCAECIPLRGKGKG
jgi:hypothetical protein